MTFDIVESSFLRGHVCQILLSIFDMNVYEKLNLVMCVVWGHTHTYIIFHIMSLLLSHLSSHKIVVEAIRKTPQ